MISKRKIQSVEAEKEGLCEVGQRSFCGEVDGQCQWTITFNVFKCGIMYVKMYIV